MESSSALPGVGVMLGIFTRSDTNTCTFFSGLFAPLIKFVMICVFGFAGGSQFQSSAPVNIPGSFSSSAPFSSPSPSPPIRPHASPFFSAHLSQPGQSDSPFLGPSHSSLGLWNHANAFCSEGCCEVRRGSLIFLSPLSSVGLNGMSTNIWEHFPSGQASSPGTPPTLLPSGPCAETSRLKQELEESHRVLKQWGHSWRHTAQVGRHAPHPPRSTRVFLTNAGSG